MYNHCLIKWRCYVWSLSDQMEMLRMIIVWSNGDAMYDHCLIKWRCYVWSLSDQMEMLRMIIVWSNGDAMYDHCLIKWRCYVWSLSDQMEMLCMIIVWSNGDAMYDHFLCFTLALTFWLETNFNFCRFYMKLQHFLLNKMFVIRVIVDIHYWSVFSDVRCWSLCVVVPFQPSQETSLESVAS